MRPGKADNSKLPASVSMSCRPRFCSKGTSRTWRAARICSRVQRGDGLGEDGGVTVFPPMRLNNEDAVDLLKINDTGCVGTAASGGHSVVFRIFGLRAWCTCCVGCVT